MTFFRRKTSLWGSLLLIWLLPLVLGSSLAEARRSGTRTFKPPVVDLLPGGVLYPKMTSAVAINPANLAKQWGIAAQVLYAPPLSSSAGHIGEASVAYASNNRYGFGATFTQSLYTAAAGNSGAVGFGVNLDKAALGLSMRAINIDTSFSPIIDAGGIFNLDLPVDFGLTVYDALGTPSLSLAVGKNFNSVIKIEGDLWIPLYSSTSPTFASYRASLVAGAIYGKWGLSGTLSYSNFRSENSLSPIQVTAGLLFWLFENFAISAQYSTPETLAVGIGFGTSPRGLSRLTSRRK